MGYQTMEELKYNPDTGELLTDRTWNYFVPLATDIPTVFNVYFRKKSYSCDAILGAKGSFKHYIFLISFQKLSKLKRLQKR